MACSRSSYRPKHARSRRRSFEVLFGLMVSIDIVCGQPHSATLGVARARACPYPVFGYDCRHGLLKWQAISQILNRVYKWALGIIIEFKGCVLAWLVAIQTRRVESASVYSVPESAFQTGYV